MAETKNLKLLTGLFLKKINESNKNINMILVGIIMIEAIFLSKNKSIKCKNKVDEQQLCLTGIRL